jgi:hypothetical protein
LPDREVIALGFVFRIAPSTPATVPRALAQGACLPEQFIPTFLSFSLNQPEQLMKSDQPFTKSFACAAFIFAIFAIVFIARGIQYFAIQLGAVTGRCLMAALITGTWGYFSKKSWSWRRVAITVAVIYVIWLALAVAATTHK